MYYSPSNNGFFPEELFDEGMMPTDAVKISDALYETLRGQIIAADADGNPALSQAPTAGPPPSVTMRQARLALLAIGKLDAALDAVAAAGPAAQIEFEFATTVDRENPLVTQLGEALDLDLDALFSAAKML